MNKLFKISLAFSILGILLLLFLSNILEPKQINIGEIDNSRLNKKVKVSGEIFKIQDKQDFKILSIKDSTGKIDVLYNCGDNLKQSLNITIVGKVQEYREYLQISADKIMSFP